MTRKREIEPRARKRRARGGRANRTRGFDDILEEDDRELPLGGDDKPPSGQ
jgi:hypothetical protein